MSFLDQMTKELLKRYGRLALGKPFAPVFLNILATSVCDMRCVHCFFTEELDDKERKKNQMKTENIVRVSETLGGNLSVLVIAGGEPFTRLDLPDIARAFYENNQLESIYLMSNGQIQKRILPDVERILTECPKLHVTVALGLDGLEADHDRIRQKPGSWARAIDTARQLQKLKKSLARLDVQTCTCVMNSNQDRLFEWYDFLKHDLRPDKINVNYIRPPAARPEELNIDLERYRRLSQMILEDSRSGQAKNVYGGPNGAFKAAVDIYMHELIAKTQEEKKPSSGVLPVQPAASSTTKARCRAAKTCRPSATCGITTGIFRPCGTPKPCRCGARGSRTAASVRTKATATTHRWRSIRSTWSRSSVSNATSLPPASGSKPLNSRQPSPRLHPEPHGMFNLV